MLNTGKVHQGLQIAIHVINLFSLSGPPLSSFLFAMKAPVNDFTSQPSENQNTGVT